MSATQPPSQLTAGTTYVYTRTLPDYPAGEWTYSYQLRGITNLDVVASVLGRDHLVAITASAAAALQGGLHKWFEVVSRGEGAQLERHIVGQGEIVVSPDPTTAAAGELQDPIERELALLRAELERRAANGGIERYSVGDNTTERRPTKEIEQRVEFLQAQLNARQRGGALQSLRVSVSPRPRLA